MTIAERIAAACTRQNAQGNGVLPPQVCRFCFGCPLATIIAGVSRSPGQTEATPIPKDHEQEASDWLDKLEVAETAH